MDNRTWDEIQQHRRQAHQAAFSAVQAGTMTFEQFEAWCFEQRAEAMEDFATSQQTSPWG